MATTIKVKAADGTWKLVSPGKLAVKTAEGAWTMVTSFQIKDGTGWVNTGYVSYPNSPTSVAIASSNYSNVTVSWGAPAAGGAPVSTYEIEQRNTSGGVLNTYTDAASPSANFPVSHDTSYRFYVRSKATSGLYSPWVQVTGGGIAIGHPQVVSQRWIREMQKDKEYGADVNLWAGSVQGPTPPGLNNQYGWDVGAYVTGQWWDIDASFTSSLTSGTRNAYYLANSGASGSPTGITLPYNYFAYSPHFPAWSNGGAWGLYLTGSGWGTNASSGYNLHGRITMFCDYYYVVLENYVSTSEVANSRFT